MPNFLVNIMSFKNIFFSKILRFKQKYRKASAENKEIQAAYQDLLQHSQLFLDLHAKVLKEGRYQIKRVNHLNMEKGSWTYPDGRIIYINGNKIDSSKRDYSLRYIKASGIIFELCNLSSVERFQKINREEEKAKQAGEGDKYRYAKKIEKVEYSHIKLYNKIIDEVKKVKTLRGIEKDKYHFKNEAEYLRVQKRTGHFYDYYKTHDLL